MKTLSQEPLSKHTFYGIGGVADELVFIDSVDELVEVWPKFSRKFILGCGSNTVFDDMGFRGAVFILNFQKTEWSNDRCIVESGREMQSFLSEIAEQGWADIINLSGIPGNIGGFICGNSGAFGVETQDVVEWVEYLDGAGNICRLSQLECRFGYRESIFQLHPEWVIVRAKLKFSRKFSPPKALQEIKDFMKKRWSKYPPGRSGGSVFKNPPNDFSGRLLALHGAKGDTMGDIQISQKHANFFINLGDGKASDLCSLIRKWQEIVFQKEGIRLMTEVRIFDEIGNIIK